ncbi:YihY family inner membrane protein [Rubrobacter tropicus]|uniref:YihY family inner membrane protein n=1 Tax=Rubrobacter tropicus TaxID=2653851 RepID=A0A6G8QBK2_9ACTN|nr:YihY/virulence factor BrkB family protein [Rubrobacter tropicus]QIN83849.1 YihY family inner membrane protein [Rubrobacter tropicus]
MAAVRGFLSDLRDIVGPGFLARVLIKVRENDLLGLAGQLTYFFLLSFFPFLIFLVALAGIVLDDPEAAVRRLIGESAGFLPREAAELIIAYLDRTLRGTGSGVLVFGIVTTLWMGSAASISITKAANRAYGLAETRPFWKLRGTSILLALGFTLLMATLSLVAFGVETFVRALGGSSGSLLSVWGIARWVVAFAVVTTALSVLYYLAPDARVPFKWITPGGFAATVLMFAASAALSFYASRLGNYDRIYGQLGAVIVFMLWLYAMGLMVLVGVEINAVLARRAEEKKGVELVHKED